MRDPGGRGLGNTLALFYEFQIATNDAALVSYTARPGRGGCAGHNNLRRVLSLVHPLCRTRVKVPHIANNHRRQNESEDHRDIWPHVICVQHQTDDARHQPYEQNGEQDLEEHARLPTWFAPTQTLHRSHHRSMTLCYRPCVDEFSVTRFAIGSSLPELSVLPWCSCIGFALEGNLGGSRFSEATTLGDCRSAVTASERHNAPIRPSGYV